VDGELLGNDYPLELSFEVFERLTASMSGPLLVEIPPPGDDVKGPFLVRQPKVIDELKGIRRPSYRDAKKALAQRYHMSDALLSGP